MKPYPTNIQLTDDRRIQIDWSDGERRLYGFRELRDNCPCATCLEKSKKTAEPTLLPVLSAAEAQPLTIRGMKPLGNYAYSIAFSDGHDTGIYTFDLLRELGTPE